MPRTPTPESLVTERLVLRRRQVQDADLVRRLWTERDPRVPAHRRVDAEGRPTVDDLAARLRAELDGPGPRLMTVLVDGEAIGYCGLVPHQDPSTDEPELAFELLRATHGHGYATEAAVAVTTWADGAGYPRLWATVWDWNVASLRVLAKVGFTDTGRVDGYTEHGDSLVLLRRPVSPTPPPAG